MLFYNAPRFVLSLIALDGTIHRRIRAIRGGLVANRIRSLDLNRTLFRPFLHNFSQSKRQGSVTDALLSYHRAETTATTNSSLNSVHSFPPHRLPAPRPPAPSTCRLHRHPHHSSAPGSKPSRTSSQNSTRIIRLSSRRFSLFLGQRWRNRSVLRTSDSSERWSVRDRNG